MDKKEGLAKEISCNLETLKLKILSGLAADCKKEINIDKPYSFMCGEIIREQALSHYRMGISDGIDEAAKEIISLVESKL